MSAIIIAIFIVLFFTLVIAVGVWSLSRLRKLGLLKGFMRGMWLLSILTTLLMVAFLSSSVGLLIGASWAKSVMIHTIYIWLVYVWGYNLYKYWEMRATLRRESPKSISHFMGRSKFFDELIEKSVALSKAAPGGEETDDRAHAVTDSPLEALLNDEDTFPELFQIGIRRKMKRKLIGLVVQTIIFLIILAFIH